MAVEVGPSDLKRSHVEHKRAAAKLESEASAFLLLFYAVECGLKAAYLLRGGKRSTVDLPSVLRTHSIRDLAKELRIGVSDFQGCKRRHDDKQKVEYRDLHEAWRYGASLLVADEGRAVEVLYSLSDWCEKENG